jgi:DHA2 family methylenomycin A resistance protein-like MFS transporter
MTTFQHATDIRSSAQVKTLVALAMGFVMATLDVTVVNVATANIQANLGISLAGLTWVVDGYILTFASLLLTGGSLANRYGDKTVYMGGLTLFVAASLLCAAAPTGTVLVAARLLQGAGAALFMPSSLSLLALAYPDEKQRARMFGIWSAIVSISSGIGPFVGGVMVDAFGWRSIFAINLPIGILGLLMTQRIIASSPRMQNEWNIASHGLGLLSLTGLSFALIEGPSYGWTSPPIVGSISLAAISAILFLLRERKAVNPILPGALVRDLRFSAANLVGLLLNLALFGGMFMLSLFLQQAQGARPMIAGLQLLPMMIVFVAGNLLFARVAPRMGTQLPMLVALIAAGVGSLLLAAIGPTTSYVSLAAIYATVNLGVGVSVPAMTATVMEAAGRAHANIAGAVLNANRQIGALVGVAVVGVVLHESADWYQGANTTFLIVALAYLTAAWLVWRFVRSNPPACKSSSAVCRSPSVSTPEAISVNDAALSCDQVTKRLA